MAAADGATGNDNSRRKRNGWPRAPRYGAGWPRILLMDDDPAIRRYLTRHLPPAGFIVLGLSPGQLEVERLRHLAPDAIVVGTDASMDPGLDLLRKARQALPVPALVLLGSKSERTVIAALDLGASDCLTKPFLIGELAARLRKTLRQALRARMPWQILRVGDLEVDFALGTVRLQGERVALTWMEHRMLRRLAEDAGNVVSARILLADGWATDDLRKIHRVRRVVQALRMKLRLGHDKAADIMSEPYVGYRLRLPGADPLWHHAGVGQ